MRAEASDLRGMATERGWAGAKVKWDRVSGASSVTQTNGNSDLVTTCALQAE